MTDNVRSGSGPSSRLPVDLVGDDIEVPCLDGEGRRYRAFDAAASTSALPGVFERVRSIVPWYSSVHRGAGTKSQVATAAYEAARSAALGFAGRSGSDDIAIICRNTTEAINHLAYRMKLSPDDIVLTTVVEHHANLLPWRRVATCRFVECDRSGRFDIDAVVDGLALEPVPKLLAITAASNVTGWTPPLAEIVTLAHERGVPVAVDAAQLAAHGPLPVGADFVTWSGHKMYAPFGSGVLIGPRRAFVDGDPFLAGGGAVDLVDLNEVIWTEPPEREEAGSPNVIGAVALHAAFDELTEIGWSAIGAHDLEVSRALRAGLAAIDGVRLLGPELAIDTLPVATFIVDGVPHALVAARLAAEYGIGVRHGCFCAHPYLIRLLGLSNEEVAGFRDQLRVGDRRGVPGAVRASAGLNISLGDVSALVDAVATISREPSRFEYHQDPWTGDFRPEPVEGYDSVPPQACSFG
jgi:selenocysteine lyase/cysteine desulfurase